jgi:hypothetical protein
MESWRREVGYVTAIAAWSWDQDHMLREHVTIRWKLEMEHA